MQCPPRMPRVTTRGYSLQLANRRQYMILPRFDELTAISHETGSVTEDSASDTDEAKHKRVRTRLQMAYRLFHMLSDP